MGSNKIVNLIKKYRFVKSNITTRLLSALLDSGNINIYVYIYSPKLSELETTDSSLWRKHNVFYTP